MAWLAVDKNGQEIIFQDKPKYSNLYDEWLCDNEFVNYVLLPKGTIKKLFGRELTWEDEPVELN